jgi:hypothetical protein
MSASGEIPAVGARSARAVRTNPLLGQAQGRLTLADSPRPGEDVRVRQPSSAHQSVQPLRDVGVGDYGSLRNFTISR